MQECIRCLEHSPEGTPEAGTHYKCTGAIYEAEHTLKYLAQKEEFDERVNEERRLRREEAEDRWKRLEKDVEAAKEANVGQSRHVIIDSVVVKPDDDVSGPTDQTRSTELLMDEEKTVEELLMEDDE